MFSNEFISERNQGAQVFPVVAVVDDTGMLAKRAIGSDTIGLHLILDDDFIVNSAVGVRDDRFVHVTQALVDADLCDIQKIGTSGNTQVVHAVTESTIRKTSYVRAVTCLRVCELVADEQARLSDQVRNQDNLWSSR